MTDIDKAREIARKHSEIGRGVHLVTAEEFEALVNGFLALDEQARRYPPAEKPEKEVDVLITTKWGASAVGHSDGKKYWYVGDSQYYSDKDIKCWRPLID